MSAVVPGSLPSATALALAMETTEVALSSSVMVMAAPVTAVGSPETAPVTEIASSSSSSVSSVGVRSKLAWPVSAPGGIVTVTSPTVP